MKMDVKNRKLNPSSRESSVEVMIPKRRSARIAPDDEEIEETKREIEEEKIEESESELIRPRNATRSHRNCENHR